jgi:hypothetical protein
LFNVLRSAPPPQDAALPVSVQLFNVHGLLKSPDAPPPDSAELLVTVQVFSVPPAAPPPKPEVLFPVKVQWFSVP